MRRFFVETIQSNVGELYDMNGNYIFYYYMASGGRNQHKFDRAR